MDLIEKTFEEVIDFSRPVAADYLDGDGQPATAGVNVPRFTHTTEGVPLGLMVERPLRESAVIRNGGWRNPQRGTWIIRGIFDNAELMRGLGFFVDASGSGTVVITYNTTSAKVFARGALQYQTKLGPVDDFGIATENLATVARIEFYPHIFSDSKAAAAAVGAVDVMPSLVTMYHEGESGFLWSSLPYYQDPAGTTEAALGDPVGLITDATDNDADMTQATVTARPILGRMPVGGRRNLLLQSENLNITPWVTTSDSSCTVVSDYATAPDGSFTASRFVPKIGARQQQRFAGSAAEYQSGSTYTTSVFVKADGYEWVQLTLTGALFGGAAWANFNSATGEFGNEGSGAVTKTATPIGDGWFRVSLTGTALDSGRGTVVSCGVEADDVASRLPEWSGNDVDGVLVWGVQMEAGGLTPYQRTSGQYDITESGAPDAYYLHFDGVDDSVSATLPAITNGTLVLAGTNGIWIDDDFNHVGGAFTVGPTTYTGGPEGILPIVGDLIVGGSFAIDRQLTAQERTRVISKLKSMGAPGVFELGPELWVSPSLGDGWSDNGDGSYTLTNDGSYSSLNLSGTGTTSDDLLLGRFNYVTTNPLSFRRDGATTDAGGATSGLQGVHFTVLKGANVISIARLVAGAPVDATVSNISIRKLELVP